MAKSTDELIKELTEANKAEHEEIRLLLEEVIEKLANLSAFGGYSED